MADSPPAGVGGGAPPIIGADVIGGTAPPKPLFICPASPEGLFDEFIDGGIEGGCEDDCEFIEGGAIGIEGIDGIVGIDGIEGGATGVKLGIDGGACKTGGVIVADGGGGCDGGPDGIAGGDTDFVS